MALTAKKLIGVRDPWGVRPLVLGELDGAPIFASETCALDIIGARFVRDVEAGEMVVATKDGIETFRPFTQERKRFCIFEYVYFARPDSMVEGVNVYDVRKRIGEELAAEAPASADMIIPVPDFGVPAALGYAAASGIPFELGIIRNHYVGRTFIEPSERIRHLGVRLKHNPNRAKLKGRRVVLVDDSIVRGTTSKKIVEMVRDAGAAEVHFRIASPPTTHSCFYGVDTPNKEELLAHRMSVEEMREYICADSSGFYLDRRSLPRHRRGRPQRPGAAVLRCLLLRPVPDPSHRCRRRHRRPPALPPRGSRLIRAKELPSRR